MASENAAAMRSDMDIENGTSGGVPTRTATYGPPLGPLISADSEGARGDPRDTRSRSTRYTVVIDERTSARAPA
jgi:hypothetical protein